MTGTDGTAPREERDFDLVVAGGGLAGVCAAIAAARGGVRTAIVHDRPVFGGNSSSEIRVIPLGAAWQQAWVRETGIVEELILADRAGNHRRYGHYGFVNSHWDLVLYNAIRREPALTAFLNTSVRRVHAAVTDSGARRIEALEAVQLASEKAFVFKARQFMDCTGDGTVGYLAGADYRYGREARDEFHEPLAPAEADDHVMGSSLLFLARDTGKLAPYEPPPWIKPYRTQAEIGTGRSTFFEKRQEVGSFWWIEITNPFHQITDAQRIQEELLTHLLGVWNWMKNHGPDREFLANFALDWTGMLPGKRESRRLMGDVIVTEADCHNDPCWPDRVAYAGWPIDLHLKGGILNSEDPPWCSVIDAHHHDWVWVAPFSLPLRAHYSRNVENLWMAGRNISVTHVALGSVRVMQSLALGGQAVGTAAAYALKNGLTPRQAADPEGAHISRIQQRLLDGDVHVFDLRNQDPADIALAASARASSAAVLSFGNPDLAHFDSLDRDLGQIFPVTHDRVDAMEFYLKNDGDTAADVRVELHELKRIWDRTAGVLAGCATMRVAPNWSGWVRAEVQAQVRPGRPHRCSLGAAPGVSWARASELPTGAVAQYLGISAGGCEPQNSHLPCFQPDQMTLPPFRLWTSQKKFARSVRVTPTPEAFGAGNVNNGLAWPLAMPNLWISDPAQPLPQWVELQFGAVRTFDSVVVSFDTDLNTLAPEAPEFWRAPHGVRDWRVCALVEGRWEQVFEESGNYQRRRKVTFDPVAAEGLRLEVLATNGAGAGVDQTARVYEIRVYRGSL